MAKPVCLVQNFYSTRQFPLHVLTGEEEAISFEAFRIGNSRRSTLDYWKPTTANAARYMRVDCAESRQAAMIVLDRGHNLAGKTIELHGSTDDFSASDVTVFTATIPATASGDDTDIDSANGALTPEGAWVKRFTAVSYRYWQLEMPALGAGLFQKVVGLWLGDTWEPTSLSTPFHDDHNTLVRSMSRVPETGWMGSTVPVKQRTGELVVKLGTTAQYVAAATHIRDNYELGRPMWIVHDDTRGERAVLGTRPPSGTMGFGYDPGWGFRQAKLPWIEHEPLVA